MTVTREVHVSPPQSERDAWTKVQKFARSIINERASAGDVQDARNILTIAFEMLSQLDRGMHVNPRADLSLDVDAPNKVAPVLERAADAYRESASELSSAWNDKGAGRPWDRIASVMDRAANSIRALPNPQGKQRHRNPPGAILALVNPAQRLIAQAVYSIEYKHKDDGKNYRHDFEEWDRVRIALTGDDTRLLIYGDGIPIVDMFPSPGE